MLLTTYLLLITDLGNIVLVGALAAVFAVYLAAAGSQRQAGALIATFILAALMIGIAKFICMSCHIIPLDLRLHSPSGHVAVSTATYSMMTAIVTAGMRRWQRWAAWLCTATLIFVIAASRVLLGFHSPEEVAVGLIAGIAAYHLVRALLLNREAVRLNGRALVLAAVVIVVMVHGISFPAEHMIQWLAAQIGSKMKVC